MHQQQLERWQHSHHFHHENPQAERNTHRVIGLTLVMMVLEIFTGWLFGSMALLADGWHMGTHFFALGIAAFAYRYSRHHATDRSYSFGTGKVSVLSGYTSAILLAGVAVLMVVESVERLVAPAHIRFNEALLVAIIGLGVNVASAFMLHDGGHDHSHQHSHDHGHSHGHHHDHNLKAAYLHVIADALTSVLAIVALLAGKHLGWIWLDPVMGMVGACVISIWAWGLLKDSSQILLDRHTDDQSLDQIRHQIEQDRDNRIADLHLRKLSPHALAAEIVVVTHQPQPPEHYKQLLHNIAGLEHVTVEIHGCPGPSDSPKRVEPD